MKDSLDKTFCRLSHLVNRILSLYMKINFREYCTKTEAFLFLFLFFFCLFWVFLKRGLPPKISTSIYSVMLRFGLRIPLDKRCWLITSLHLFSDPYIFYIPETIFKWRQQKFKNNFINQLLFSWGLTFESTKLIVPLDPKIWQVLIFT